MKNIRYMGWALLLAVAGLTACHQTTIGYLITEHAGYEIDSLLVKAELDIAPPEIVPNPEYEMFLEWGFTPDEIIGFGIFPTIKEGGGEDYERHRLGIPWTSTPIEGVEGTMPIHASIRDVKTDVGDVSKLLEYLTVRGNGVFSIPVENDIPVGRYTISLTFTNEGYTKSVEDIFTIIVR